MGVLGALERRRGSWETEHWGVGGLESQMLFSSIPPCLLLSICLLFFSNSLADRLPLRVEVQKHPTSIKGSRPHVVSKVLYSSCTPNCIAVSQGAHVAFEVLSLASYWDEQ